MGDLFDRIRKDDAPERSGATHPATGRQDILAFHG